MTYSNHDLVARIFSNATELADSERKSYLDEACEGDTSLRKEVNYLLLHANAGSTVLAASDNSTRLKRIGQSLTMPETVGPYTVLRTLGDGGMAIVYLAQQKQPLRDVALKMIKPGMDTAQILKRFDAEREALASMRHPGIATVFDAGINQDGRSYFVMEHVNGKDIYTYCKDHKLTIKERLQLMIQVCEATIHAHQKGIIHRDLKPSNILVAEEDGKRQPKIIDFGIARSVSPYESAASGLTQHNQVVGTPDYMSPEQASSNSIDIDTRTDVYSLASVLHELLLGQRPKTPVASATRGGLITYSAPVLSTGSMLRRASESELAQLALERNSTTAAIIEQMGGDLNWILNQALQPDREQRYASVSELRDDISRFLNGKAVNAHPPSRRYQLRCFLRNHVVGVSATAAVVVALATSTTGLAIGLNRADEARRLAEQAQLAAIEAQQATEHQSQLAQLESRRATEVTEFMIDLFDVASPFTEAAADLNARELLQRGVKNIQTELQDQPLVRASMLESMARAHLNLGQYVDAEPIASEALALTEREPDKANYLPARIQTHRTRGLVHFYQGEYEKAEPLYERALELHRQSALPDVILEAELLHNLGNAIFEQGQYAKALELFSQALNIRTSKHGGHHVKIAESLNSVASAQRRLGNLEEALEHYQLALNMRVALNQERHPDTAITLSNLGVIHFNLRRFDEAEAYLLQALDIQQEVFDNDHPQVGTVLANLGATLAASKQLGKAKNTLEESVDWHRDTLGSDHPNTANAMLNLGSVLQQLGELEQSATLFRQCITIYLKSGNKTPVLGVAMANLSETLLRQNQPVEALTLAKNSQIQLSNVLPENHPWLAVATAAVGAAEAANGNRDLARDLLKQSLPTLEKTFGTDGTRTVSAQHYLKQLEMP